MRPLYGDAATMQHKHVSDVAADALSAHDFSYFEAVDEFVQQERVDDVDPYMHGARTALGIAKGHPFTPTDRQVELLDLATKTGVEDGEERRRQSRVRRRCSDSRATTRVRRQVSAGR